MSLSPKWEELQGYQAYNWGYFDKQLHLKAGVSLEKSA